jgi:hypothetical protein
MSEQGKQATLQLVESISPSTNTIDRLLTAIVRATLTLTLSRRRGNKSKISF